MTDIKSEVVWPLIHLLLLHISFIFSFLWPSSDYAPPLFFLNLMWFTFLQVFTTVPHIMAGLSRATLLCFDLLSLSCPLLFCSRHHSNYSHTSVKLSMSVYFGSYSFLLSPGILFCVQFGFRLTGGPVHPLHPKSIWHKNPSIIIP